MKDLILVFSLFLSYGSKNEWILLKRFVRSILLHQMRLMWIVDLKVITGFWSNLRGDCLSYLLFTAVFFNNFDTCLALDMATPMELAITSFLRHDLLCVVTSATAKDRTAVESRRGFVANAIGRSCFIKKRVNIQSVTTKYSLLTWPL